MPSKSEKQRRFMGAELARKRAGKKTKTSMSESKLSDFASKSIDAYLYKHGRVLPCGHHAEEGSEIDKACSVSGCDTQYATPQGYQGGVNVFGPGRTSASSGPPVTWTNTGASPTASVRAAHAAGVESGAFQPEGGFRRSADPIELINTYLDKQSRAKCKHKKGDPSHLEAA